MTLRATIVCLLIPAVALVHVGGCTHYTDSTTVPTTTNLGGNKRVRLQGVPGEGSIRADGTFQYRVTRARLCEREERVKDETKLVEHKRLSGAGIASVVFGAIILVGAIGAGGGEGAGIGLGFGALFIGPPMISRLSNPTRERVVSSRTNSTGFQEVACDQTPATVLGEMTVTTPWGGTATATPDQEDTAVFTIDWSGAGIDATSPDARARLGGSWKLTATTANLSAFWEPSRADVDSAMTLIGGGIPSKPPAVAVESFSVESEDLIAGQSTSLRLTVTNRGEGTAHDLVARTRSSVPALHNVEFSFGKVAPGKTVTRSAVIKVAANETESSATVVVVFSEANAFQPANHTQRFAIRLGLCPEGKLTRAQYQAKRDKLQRAFEAGALTQAELDQYDAELVTCLK